MGLAAFYGPELGGYIQHHLGAYDPGKPSELESKMATANPTASVKSKTPPKPEEFWHPARLIPTTGIGGQDEQELRATSSLLAVIRAVPQVGRALLVHAGAPIGRDSTYTEIRFSDENDKLSIPDGAVVVEWGKKRWVCLVEVKTGGAELRAEQVIRYVDLARTNGFDAVLTVSNQITGSPNEVPIAVDARRLKKVALRHLSWWQVMTEARMEHKHRGVSDPDQAWILGELIAYLDHERAGAAGFDDLGDKWVAVREGARTKTLRAADPAVREVAKRWEQYVQYLALGLTQDLGRNVEALWPRKVDAAHRSDTAVRALVDEGKMAASIRVPAAIAPIDLQADLRVRLFETSVDIQAPREGRAKTRLVWLLRQLKDAPDACRIDVRYPNARETVSQALKDVRDKPERLLMAADLKREPRAFRISLAKELGAKRGRGAGSFVLESKNQTTEFYRNVVQGLRPWAAAAPKLPGPGESTDQATSDPPPFSTPDGRAFGDATQPES